MRNAFDPRYCGPSGTSFPENHYLEDTISGASITLAPEKLLTISMPLVDDGNDHFCNERLLMALTTEAIELLQSEREMARIRRHNQADLQSEHTSPLRANLTA